MVNVTELHEIDQLYSRIQCIENFQSPETTESMYNCERSLQVCASKKRSRDITTEERKKNEKLLEEVKTSTSDPLV